MSSKSIVSDPGQTRSQATELSTFQNKGRRAVANWIILGIIMLLIQVILGGITRLTGSGLSITEWNVITGTVPPLNEQQWVTEFQKYQQTPQYQLLNTDFTLSDFKFIFFWEWFHRFWARLIGVVFVVGFVYLVARKYLRKEMQGPLISLFLLGALQGAVGWIMVASGLTGDAVYVKPTRLALHFLFAMGLIFYALWFALQLTYPASSITRNNRLRRSAIWLTILVIIQLGFGALMAGHKAATAAPTWPDINGSAIPGGIFAHEPWALNFIDNKITIHFVHRSLAYVILVLTVLFTWQASRKLTRGTALRKAGLLPTYIVTLQVILGIIAVLSSPKIIPNHWGLFEWMAILHQLLGMLLLLAFAAILYFCRPERGSARVTA